MQIPNTLNREMMLQSLAGYCDFVFDHSTEFLESFMPELKHPELLDIHFAVERARVSVLLECGTTVSTSFLTGDVLDWVDYQRS